MAKTSVERQIDFRTNRKAEGGMRLDMWLPPEEAAKLRTLVSWSDKSGPQVILDLITEAWKGKAEKRAFRDYADGQFEYACLYARTYASGEGTDYDRIEAIKWFEKSHKQGYRKSAIDNNFGVLSYMSDDKKGAARYFRKSAAQGNKVGLYNLGLLGLEGRGVTQPYPQVAECFQKSAEQGFNPAQWLLGVLHAVGKGVPQDHEKAREWLRRGNGKDLIPGENFLAWWLSTFPDDKYDMRDGQVAVTIAERVVRSRASRDHLGTLAAAYAETKRFDEAIRIQKKVCLKLHQGSPSQKRNALLKDCERRLTNFMAQKPWRDTSLKLEYLWDFGET